MPDSIKLQRRVARALTLGLAPLVLAFVATNAYPYSSPEPLWTAADLPFAARDIEEGWSFVHGYQAELPKPLVELVRFDASIEQDPAIFWRRVEREREGLRGFLASDEAREGLRRVDLARQTPAFTDPGPRDDLTWLKLHRIASLHALELAQQGELAESSDLLRDLIRMDLAQLAHAHSLIGFLVALANLQCAIYQADLIVQRLDPAAREPEARAALAELGRELEGVDIEAIDLRRVVVGEYLNLVEMLDDEPASALTGWLYSRPLTLRGINERFEAHYQAALAHDTLAALGGDDRSPTQELGWWVRNPLGKRFLDATQFRLESVAAGIDEDLAALGEVRSSLRRRLTAAL